MSPQYSARNSRNSVNFPVEDWHQLDDTDFMQDDRLLRVDWKRNPQLVGAHCPP